MRSLYLMPWWSCDFPTLDSNIFWNLNSIHEILLINQISTFTCQTLLAKMKWSGSKYQIRRKDPMSNYSRSTLLYSRDQHNIIKQLSTNSEFLKYFKKQSWIIKATVASDHFLVWTSQYFGETISKHRFFVHPVCIPFLWISVGPVTVITSEMQWKQCYLISGTEP